MTKHIPSLTAKPESRWLLHNAQRESKTATCGRQGKLAQPLLPTNNHRSGATVELVTNRRFQIAPPHLLCDLLVPPICIACPFVDAIICPPPILISPPTPMSAQDHPPHFSSFFNLRPRRIAHDRGSYHRLAGLMDMDFWTLKMLPSLLPDVKFG